MVPAVSNGVSPAPPYSGYCLGMQSYLYGAITLYRLPFQVIPIQLHTHLTVLQPQNSRNCSGLGSSAFARHYLRNHYYFLFLQVLRCFSSLGLPPLLDNTASRYWVVPFGNLRINSYVLIPVAYRSLSRPSSSLRAKAFPTRP